MLSSTPTSKFDNTTAKGYSLSLSPGAKHGLLRNMCNLTETHSSTENSSGRSFSTQPGQQALARPIPSTAWQTSADIPDRLRLLGSIRNIVMEKMLQSPGATTNKISKLPVMTRKMEEILYRAAQTKEEYTDLSTLQARLHMISRALKRRINQQQSMNSTGMPPPPPPPLSSSWQSSEDKQDRLTMLQHIKKLVKKQIVDKCGTTMIHKLPQVAKTMESALYRSAPSKRDYMDMSTLNSRLQAITDDLLSGHCAT